MIRPLKFVKESLYIILQGKSLYYRVLVVSPIEPKKTTI